MVYIEFRSFLYGHMHIRQTRSFDQSRQSPIGALACAHPSSVLGGTKQPDAARSFNLSGSWTSKLSVHRDRPFASSNQYKGSMKDKVVLNPPGSARYGRRLRQSAGLVDR